MWHITTGPIDNCFVGFFCVCFRFCAGNGEEDGKDRSKKHWDVQDHICWREMV